MIYTVGDRESYERLLDSHDSTPLKLGPRASGEACPEEYPGGCAFRTKLDAESYIARSGRPEYSVYGLIGSYDEDTYQHPDHEHRCLNKDLPIVRIS